MKSDAYQAFLLDYTTGALTPELALAAELHLVLNESAEDITRVWQAAGRALAPTRARPERPHLPEALELACGEFETVPWKRGLSGVNYAKRGKGKGQLMRLDPGQSAPMHSHSVLEATVVLKGQLDDGFGAYSRGDIVLGRPGVPHQPAARGDDMCICYVAREPIPFWRLS